MSVEALCWNAVRADRSVGLGRTGFCGCTVKELRMLVGCVRLHEPLRAHCLNLCKGKPVVIVDHCHVCVTDAVRDAGSSALPSYEPETGTGVQD